MTCPPPPPLAELLAHREFVRRVARRLSHDLHSADDLEQHLWLRALESPPRHGHSLRGWLARILTNLARNRATVGAGAWETAEIPTTEADARPTPDEIAAMRSVEREMKRVLAKLEKHYREVVRLHYFEELSAPQISERLGLSTNTVYTRLRRGLEQLRQKLEPRRERIGWVASMVGFLRRPKVALPLAVPSVLSVACLVWFTMPGADPELARGFVRPDSAGSPGQQEVTQVSGRRAPAEIEPSATETGPSLAGPVELASLDVRVRYEDTREPAAGIELALEDRGGRALPTQRASTDADGRARWAEVAPGAWWIRSERGIPTRTVLGEGANELVLEVPHAGRDVEVLVSTARGRPVDRARVWLSWPSSKTSGRDVGWTDAAGRLTIPDVSPDCYIGARHAARGGSRTVAVDAHEEDAPIQLALAGRREPMLGIVVDTEGKPIPGAQVEMRKTMAAYLLSAGRLSTDPPSRTTETDSEGRFNVLGLSPYHTSVRVTHPEYEYVETVPRIFDAVTMERKKSRRIVLRRLPDAAEPLRLHGDVRTLDGRPAAGWVVTLLPRDDPGWHVVLGAGDDPLDVRRAITGANGRFVFEGCADEAHRLFLSPPGHGALSSRTDVHPSGEPLILAVPEPVAGAELRGRLEIAEPEGLEVCLTSTHQPRLFVAEVDALGSFRFDALPPGDYSLSVRGQRFLRRDMSRITVHPGEYHDLGTLAVQPGATVSLRLDVEGEVPPRETFRARLQSRGLAIADNFADAGSELTFPDVPPGEYTLSLHWGGARHHHGRFHLGEGDRIERVLPVVPCVTRTVVLRRANHEPWFLPMQVELVTEAGATILSTTKTEPKAEFPFKRRFPLGTTRLHVGFPDGSTFEQELHIDSGLEPETIVVEMP